MLCKLQYILITFGFYSGMFKYYGFVFCVKNLTCGPVETK
jgi:hypothetical protein